MPSIGFKFITLAQVGLLLYEQTWTNHQIVMIEKDYRRGDDLEHHEKFLVSCCG
jgi:hypothetical protein